MKFFGIFFTTVCLCVSLGASAQAADTESEWETDPTLRAVRVTADTVIISYQEWFAEWLKSDRVVRGDDLTVNSLAEGAFITILTALKQHPNPELLEQCLKFCALDIPQAFDDQWRLVLLELSDVDGGVTAKVDQLARDAGIPTPAERSMK